MPVGKLKNQIYGLSLGMLGKRCQWTEVCAEGGSPAQGRTAALGSLLRHRHVVGTAMQVIRAGRLAERYAAGLARLGNAPMPVTHHTFFRTASVAKLAAALLTFRLQTLGMLDVEEDIAAFLGFPVRNPSHPDVPITLGMLLAHTSSIVDSPAYFAALSKGTALPVLLQDAAAFSGHKPGARFRYSNLAAGMIGCLLEARFGRCFESLAQEYLFAPLGADGSFDMRALEPSHVADSYRVLPNGKGPAFDALRRWERTKPLAVPDPATHYMLASGNLYITAEGMARLLLPLVSGGEINSNPFLNQRALSQMKTPLGYWPEAEIPMGHGMGLLTLQDPTISHSRLYGHQGFAYGAVNGVFFNEEGDGFVCLNSGASEQRLGHLSLLNKDLIGLLLP